MIWIGLAVWFYLADPSRFGKIAGLLLGFACCPGLLIVWGYGIAKAPKGTPQTEYGSYAEEQDTPSRRESWHPSGVSDEQWYAENDSRLDFTSRDYEG